MGMIAQLNGNPISGGHAWHAVLIERDSFNKVYRWVFDTYSRSRTSGDSSGTWLCWDDISEIWFEYEKDAMLCVMKWQ